MPPLSLLIKPVSGACNLRCGYCFYRDEMDSREEADRGRMSLAALEKLLRRAFLYAEGTLSLAFQGGEPTLAGPAFYEAMLALEKKYNTRNIRVMHALQTNGYALSDRLIDVLKEGGFLLGVSIDGTREIHDGRRVDARGRGSYDQVMDNLRRLREKRVDYNVLTVVDAEVAARPGEVYQALRQHGYLQFIPCLDALDGATHEASLTAPAYGRFLTETFRLYAEDFRRGRFTSVRNFDNWLNMLNGVPPELCGMRGVCGRNYLVEADLSVYPCDFYALDEWRLGSADAQSFFALEKAEAAQRFVDSSRRLMDKCRACQWLDLCRGGCRRDREPDVGVNRLCEGFQYFFERCADEMKALATLPPPRMPRQY